MTYTILDGTPNIENVGLIANHTLNNSENEFKNDIMKLIIGY